MYCLLCHEKIPRLRAWRTKSEFCSDEHAAQYKKQTLDRLLTDQNPARKETPSPVVLTDEPEDDLAYDEMSLGIPMPDPTALEGLAQESPEPEPEDVFASAPGEGAHDDSGDGVEELWRLAEEIDHSDSGMALFEPDADSPDVSRQSAEDALKALRMLAEKATESKGQAESEQPEESDADRFLREYALSEDGASALDEIEDLPPISDDLIAELGSDLPDFEDPSREAEPAARQPEQAGKNQPLHQAEDDEPAHDESPAPAAAGGMHLADDDAPSILERLMEDPAANWPQKAVDAATPQAARQQQAHSPEVHDLDDDPFADFADLPEPEFSFDDDSLDAVAETVEEPASESVSEDTVDDEAELEEDSLADLVALADDLDDDDAEVDPLDELIKAEEAAKQRSEEFDADSALDEAVAEELVRELAEEALRDDLDLQELERNLKVVPFPSPSKDQGTNGRHQHADQIAEDVDEAIESNPLRAAEGSEKPASAKAPSKPEKPSRPGRTRTKFKPSTIMAGVEPAIQGYLQGDPLETWRANAVESAWGERGLPSVHSFEASPPARSASGELEALRPQRDFRGRMNLPITVCTPAEAPAIEAPRNDLEPTRSETAPPSPQALSQDASASMRLGPEYRPFDDVAAISLNYIDPTGGDEPSDPFRDQVARIPDAIEPSKVFYDSVSVEARFVEEDDWDAPAEPPDPTAGIDLSADFADEQPAAQSSGGRRQY